jgi:hypothetical protein
MQYRDIIAVCSEIYRNRKIALCGKYIFLNIKPIATCTASHETALIFLPILVFIFLDHVCCSSAE